MADGITAEIAGNQDVIANLSALSANIQAQVQQAMRDAGDMALNIADSLVPVDTGELQSSIVLTSGSDLNWELAATAPYSLFVEMGHHTKSGSFVPPQHFLLPAFDETSRWLQSTLRAIVGQ